MQAGSFVQPWHLAASGVRHCCSLARLQRRGSCAVAPRTSLAPSRSAVAGGDNEPGTRRGTVVAALLRPAAVQAPSLRPRARHCLHYHTRMWRRWRSPGHGQGAGSVAARPGVSTSASCAAGREAGRSWSARAQPSHRLGGSARELQPQASAGGEGARQFQQATPPMRPSALQGKHQQCN